MGGIKNKLSKLSNKAKNLLTNGQFLPLDGEGGRRSLSDEVTKAKGFCFTNTPHPMATPSALPAVGEGNNKPPFHKRGVAPVALRVGAHPASRKCDDRRADEQSSSGEVNNKGSRLPSFSQPSEMPDGQISNTRKLNYLGLYASKTIGSLRPIKQDNIKSAPAKGEKCPAAFRVGEPPLAGCSTISTVKTYGFQPVGLFSKWNAIAKYTGIACISLAILSTLTLNIIATYSQSNTNSNAEPASGASTNATPASSSSLSLSFSNATGSCTDTSNPANVCMEIPDGGGIATGGHTVTVRTPADATGYELTLSSADENDTSLVNVSNPDVDFAIDAIDTGVTGGVPTPVALSDAPNRWGFTAGDNSQNPDDLVGSSQWFGVLSGARATMMAREQPADQVSGDSITLFYGINIPNPVTIPAGTYSTGLVYTLTVTLPSAPAPTLSKLALNDTALTNQTKEYALEGANLSTAYDVWVDFNDNSKKDNGESATNLTTYPNTDKANTVISFTNPASNTPGVYDIYVETYGGQAKLDKAYRVVEESICQSGNPNSDCQVDIDAHMIPVKYTGGTGEGGDGIPAQWTVVAKDDTNNPGDWYDYSEKKWANAVTVKDYTKYQTPGTVINEDDVLGYWVYIPRYAYEVQRRDATDHYVDGKYALPDNVSTTTTDSHVIRNDFIIQFEKASDTPKEPTLGCSTLSGSTLNAKDYRTECNLNRTYGQATGTTWATHPAFRWKYTQAVNGKDEDKEVNGFWMGKFETTGSAIAPTVLPNERRQTSIRTDNYNVAGDYGSFQTGMYAITKSLGVNDRYNIGGELYKSGVGLIYPEQNSHRLDKASSHMAKNSEWGAATYLSFSVYGAGSGNVQMNTSGTEAKNNNDEPLEGVTGCGPYDDGDITEYSGGGAVSTQGACSTQNRQRAWNGSIGQLASTTNNWYGVYDMAGGGYEFMATVSTNYVGSTGTNRYFAIAANAPYFDLIQNSVAQIRPSWSSSTSITSYSNDTCTWEMCGGQALHETKKVQSVTGDGIQSWMGDSSMVYSVSDPPLWITRGGEYDYGSFAGEADMTDHMFTNFGADTNGFRVSLLVE